MPASTHRCAWMPCVVVQKAPKQRGGATLDFRLMSLNVLADALVGLTVTPWARGVVGRPEEMGLASGKGGCGQRLRQTAPQGEGRCSHHPSGDGHAAPPCGSSSMPPTFPL